jgi:hypothetical protein
LQTFEDIYSSYCDCGKFVKWLDESLYSDPGNTENQYAWFISRGAELCDLSDGVCKFYMFKQAVEILFVCIKTHFVFLSIQAKYMYIAQACVSFKCK